MISNQTWCKSLFSPDILTLPNESVFIVLHDFCSVVIILSLLKHVKEINDHYLELKNRIFILIVVFFTLES
jgi:hypothetical protein